MSNSYICMYKEKQFEIQADSTFGAQMKCAQQNKIKDRYSIDVYLVEKDGEPVIHNPAEL